MRLYIGSSGGYIYGSSTQIGIKNDVTTNGTLVFDTASGNLTASGNVTAYSDIRIKENVLTIRNALDRLCTLRGVEYIRSDTKEPGIGVMVRMRC